MAGPPFSISATAWKSLAGIERLIGRFEGLNAPMPAPRLRRQNRVRTLQGSTAIEGNTLSLEQVTALLDGKRVVAPRKDLLEVQNAMVAYRDAKKWRPWSASGFLSAHGTLMAGLLPDAGTWRQGNVGIWHGRKVSHVAPPARRVPELMRKLFSWIKRDGHPLLVKSAVAHYEIQFIHPFSDGNGRMGRLWQHVMLLGVSPIFEFVPIESLIFARQNAYYAALSASDRSGDSTPFIDFSLATLVDALEELVEGLRPERERPEDRLRIAREALGRSWFTRQDYLRLHTNVSTATASRDLKQGVLSGVLRRRGLRNRTCYGFA